MAFVIVLFLLNKLLYSGTPIMRPLLMRRLAFYDELAWDRPIGIMHYTPRLPRAGGDHPEWDRLAEHLIGRRHVKPGCSKSESRQRHARATVLRTTACNNSSAETAPISRVRPAAVGVRRLSLELLSRAFTKVLQKSIVRSYQHEVTVQGDSACRCGFSAQHVS